MEGWRPYVLVVPLTHYSLDGDVFIDPKVFWYCMYLNRLMLHLVCIRPRMVYGKNPSGWIVMSMRTKYGPSDELELCKLSSFEKTVWKSLAGQFVRRLLMVNFNLESSAFSFSILSTKILLHKARSLTSFSNRISQWLSTVCVFKLSSCCFWRSSWHCLYW